MFTVDVRSLAIMRIAVATSVLADLFTRLVHLREHYSDDGAVPREVARAASWVADASLLALSGSPVWALSIFAIAIALALAVLVGWRTRLATPLLWVAVASIQHRNPILWDHRDAVFACALCCGTLLPWGDAFSLDAARGPARGMRYTGAPAVAYIVQVACIYLFAALLKDGPEWRSDFTAVEHAISLDYWAQPAARVLREHPGLASVLTAAVLAFEAAVAPLLLCPWRATRWIVVAGICALQLGFALFLWLDTFPMIATAFTLGLVPWPDASDDAPPPSRATSIGAGAYAVYIVALGIATLAGHPTSALSRPAELLGIEQRWTMFAPAPTRLDGWFVVQPAGRPVDVERPASFREGIRTTRELVYMRHLLQADDAARHAFAATRCAGAPAIAVYFVGVVAGEVQEPELLVEHTCR